MVQTLNSSLAWWARMQPDVKVLTIDGQSLTYADLHAWSETIAHRLVADGLKPGERVGVCSSNSLEYCALAFAVMRAGGVFLPMNLRFTRHEAAEVIEDATPTMLYTDAERRDRLDGHGVPLFNLADLEADRGPVRGGVAHDPQPDDPVVIITTSGSTARPKGVVFSHRTMSAYATEFLLQEPTISKGARILVLAPLSTSAGFVQLIHYTTLGCSLFLEPVFEAQKALDILVREKINGFGGVPVLFERIAALDGFAAADLSSLRLVTVGGARVTQQLLQTWMAKDIVIRQIYGQTECGGNATIMPEHLARTMPEKCGWGGPFSEIVTVRPDGSRCAPNEVGEILIRGPGRMVGYWNNPKATADAVRDGWLYTGDLGMLDEQGLLTFVDRVKDIIISGGLNISAAEVERCIGEFSGVEEVLVIAAPDAKFGETPFAVVYSPGPIEIPALIAHCNERLSDYKVPRYVVVETEPLPRLATNKLSKPAVRARYKDKIAELPRVR